MIKLIASDLDGTIIDNYLSIPKDNLKASKFLKSKNVSLAICTGKTYALSADFCKILQADFGIFGNGSQIIDLTTGNEIAKKVLEFSEIETCFSIAKKYNLHVHVYTKDSIISPCLLYMDLRNSILFHDKLDFIVTPSCFEYIKQNNDPIFKLVISAPFSLSNIKSEIEKNINLNITQIFKTGIYKDTIIDKEYEYLDISPFNVSKGNALLTLSNYLNMNKQNILSIGDNLNDIDMFNSSAFRVAVNNAHELVKNHANYITHKSATNGGFAEAIYKFISF